MKEMTLKNITLACNGEYFGEELLLNEEIAGIVIDSRKVCKDFLFIPIKGARVDGHDFINQVFEMGAKCVLSEKKLDTNKPYILVESTTEALKKIAAFYRRVLGVKVVGVSGSVGKTSTKEMIASVLSTKYNVLKTEGNFNNEIGLPLTIFRLTTEHEVAVLEMGISDFDEMRRLSAVAAPDICVLTNIGYCHLENLIDRDGVLKAKTEMFENMSSNGIVILNGDDDKLQTVTFDNDIPLHFFGMSSQNEIYAKDIKNNGIYGTECTICLGDASLEVNIKIPGEHMVYNALAAAMVGKVLNLSNEDIVKGINNAVTISGRCNVIYENDIVIVDDCYNANPMSMKAAIDLLKTANSRKIAILGDMFELGSDESELHYEVGKYAAENELDFVMCIGKNSEYMYKGAMDANVGKRICYLPEMNNMREVLKRCITKGDTILVKASHGMNFQEIVDILKNPDFFE